jgi:hypothetical protein
MILGRHPVPFELSFGNLKFSLAKQQGLYLYQRSSDSGREEKLVASDSPHVLVQPVEPVNLPRPLSFFLLLDFTQSITLAPKAICKVYLTFPIELAVILTERSPPQPIDIFSLVKPRFSLYGEPRTGVLCRYWQSDVESIMPSPDPLIHGVLELTISNSLAGFVEVNKAVFSAYGMKLSYNNQMTSMRGEMEIISATTAETRFKEPPLRKGMTKGEELYSGKKTPLLPSKYEMHEGL